MEDVSFEELMISHQFTKQDVIALLDSLIARWGKNTPPQKIAELECKRLGQIRQEMEKQKVRVSES